MNKTTAHHLNQHARKRRECMGGVFALFALTTLSACGWRVRGKVDLPYRNLLLSGSMTQEFRDTLEMYLGVNDITLVKSAKEAEDRKSTRLNSSHSQQSRMPSSA